MMPLSFLFIDAIIPYNQSACEIKFQKVVVYLEDTYGWKFPAVHVCTLENIIIHEKSLPELLFELG